MGGLVRFTAVFTTPAAGSTQLIGLGTSENAFCLGFVDTDLVIRRPSDSVHTNETSNKFNYPLSVNIDFTKGNVFEINYQWLGFGLIRYSIEDPKTGIFKPLHDIRFANTSEVPSLINPTMPVMSKVENTTNNTNIVLKTASSMAFREGAYIPTVDPLTLFRSFSSGEVTVTTEVPILSVRAKTTYQSVTNLIHPMIGALSLSSEGNKGVSFKVYVGGALTGASWSDYSTNTSSLESDTSATVLTGGAFVFDYNLAKSDALTDQVSDFNFELSPGQIFTVTATSTQTNDVTVSLLFQEPF